MAITRYTLPNNASTNITSMYTMFEYVQEVSSDWFFVLLSFFLAVVIMISLKNYETPKAFATACFFNMIFMILFGTLGFVSNIFMYLSIVILAFSVVWLHLSNSGRL